MTEPRDHFARLTHAEQIHAIRSLAQGGHSDHEIARMTRLHVEQIRRLLSPDAEAAALHARTWSER